MSVIRFGISELPTESGDDVQFLDDLVDKGHQALELPFTAGFPWKQKQWPLGRWQRIETFACRSMPPISQA
jgi:hypothetical protein